MSFDKLRKKLFFISLPLTLIYYIITSVRNILYDKKILASEEFDIPVISVGNITVGGTGKTPHIEYLIHLLKNEFSVAVLSRGYKRDTKEFVLAAKGSLISEIGDEPKQIKDKYPEINVAVDRKRVNGIKILKENIHDLNAILLDDAFQHRSVIPGISILLIDYNRPVFKDHILPFGDLRESVKNISRASIVIVTKTPENIKPIEKRIWKKNLKLMPYQKLYFTSFKYGSLRLVYGKSTGKIEVNDIKKNKYSVLLITGIANPKPLIGWIKKHAAKVQSIHFPDHHNFTKDNVAKIGSAFEKLNAKNKIILTTEKDAVRFREMDSLSELSKKFMYYVPVEVKFLGEDQKTFDSDIIDFVKFNKKFDQLI